MDDRAAAPVVGKALEIAVLVVFVGLVSAALFGSVVPAYRTAAGAEVGDRVIVAAAGQVEHVADAPRSVESRRVGVAVPRTIRGSTYVVRATEEDGVPALVLDHPTPEIGGTVALALPARVTAVEGDLHSAEEPTVVVSREPGGALVVVLE